jgi:branched-chain amino acid aminotransferase/4-amino-4-deoxychorismate lyase
MKALYNDQFVALDEFAVGHDSRVFQYGDGLFETIAVIDGKPRYVQHHLERLKKGLEILQIQPKVPLSEEGIQLAIGRLMTENTIANRARAKLMIWRSNGGTYTPANNQGEVFLKILPASQPGQAKSLATCTTITNMASLLSGLKTMSALKYTLAALEAQQMKVDDLVIKDINGNISECLASNIFWVHQGQYYTPALSTGCIDGVMRRVILESLAHKGQAVNEVEAPIEVLHSAQHIFTTNAMGVVPVTLFSDRMLAPHPAPEMIHSWVD